MSILSDRIPRGAPRALRRKCTEPRADMLASQDSQSFSTSVLLATVGVIIVATCVICIRGDVCRRKSRNATAGDRDAGRPHEKDAATESIRAQIQSNLDQMNALLTDMKPQDVQEQTQKLRDETMHLFKKFRAAGGSVAQRDKLSRDFQDINKKVVAVCKKVAAAPQQQTRPHNQEDLITQRERHIQEVESTMADVAEIIQDLAVVQEQTKPSSSSKSPSSIGVKVTALSVDQPSGTYRYAWPRSVLFFSF